MNREKIFEYIEAHQEDHIAHMQRWIRQKSVSWDMKDEDMIHAAHLVAQSYKDLGCKKVEIIEGRFHPGVWAHYDVGAQVTIHNYCMFDTRPANFAEWSFNPWGAELVQIGDFPKVLVGRGAMGAKGPYVAWLNALASIIAVEGELPLNIMFLAEGEEILGSPSYRGFAEKYKEQLKSVDASFVPSMTQASDGTVFIGLGLKGMVVVELTASGESWGFGPKNPVHSMMAPLVDCPPFRLTKALACLTDAEGRNCAVDGLKDVWNYRKPLTIKEKNLIEQLTKSVKAKGWRNGLPLGGTENVQYIRGGMKENNPLINLLYGPSFNISGIRSGFLGAKTGTIPFVIPNKATATIDMRLVVDMSPEEILNYLRKHLDKHGFNDIEMDVFASFSHSITDIEERPVQAMIQTLKNWNVNSLIWPIQGGGGPWTVIPNAFNVPCVRGGSIGGGVSRPVDEFIVIEGNRNISGLIESEKYMVDLVLNLAEIYRI
jgi:acetylornithine deacetylase/succinyl-diaminopimelate desuccinylase-like protein